MSRPLKANVIPASAIREAYLDLDTTLRVSAERLGCGNDSIVTRARAMGLPSRGVLLTERARARAEKPCKRCCEVKPATAEHFNAELRNRDGLDVYCKPCSRWYSRASMARRRMEVGL